MGKRVLAVLIAALLLTSFLTASDASAVGYNTTTDWAGAANDGARYYSIDGTFTIPTPTESCGATGVMAAWIGIGGDINVPFAQSGYTITATSVGSWFEVFDAAGTPHEQDISAPADFGDVVTETLHFNADRSIVYFGWVNDTLHTTVTYAVENAQQYYNGTSAEWIVERQPYNPAVNNAMLSMSHPLTWTGARAYANTYSYPASGPNTQWDDLGAVTDPTHLLEKVTPSPVGSTSFSLNEVHCH